MAKQRDEKLARFVADLVLIHGNEYQRLGMTKAASLAFLLIDPVFEALEIAADNLEPVRLKGDALRRVMEAEATLEQVGFGAEHGRLRKAIEGLKLARRELEWKRKQARGRVSTRWRRGPAPLETDGLCLEAPFPFRSVKVARQWVIGLRCPRCEEELALAEHSFETPGATEGRLISRLRCEGSCRDPVLFYSALPSALRLRLSTEIPKRGTERAPTTREYIDLLKSLSPFPLAENDVIEPECVKALAAVREVLPRVRPGEVSPDTLVEIGVIPGLFGHQTSPFLQKCRDGFAIIVPEMFVIRISRFARHLAQTWGVRSDQRISRTVAPALKGKQAKELARMLYRDFWDVGIETMPTEVPEQMDPLLIAILENCMTFVIAHELAHIHLGHAGRRHYISLSEEAKDVPFLSYEQPDEIVADQMASRLLRQVVREKSENELLETFAMASVDVFFTLLTLIEQKFSPDPRKHPSAHVRRAALRSQVGVGISGQSLLFGVAAQQALEAQVKDPPPAPDFPEILSGNWQDFELALRSLSLGENERSLADLTRFLIRDPSNEEGWELLRHLLLADQPGTALLSPRGAILAVPEISENEIVIKMSESLVDPVGGRQVERKIWMKYAEELLRKAAKAGHLELIASGAISKAAPSTSPVAGRRFPRLPISSRMPP